MPDLLDEGHHLVAALERGMHQLAAHLAQHTWKEQAMQYLDDLIASGQKLKAERADLVKDRDAQKARADTAEGALATLQQQTAGDEAKAQAALADLDAEVQSEAATQPAAAAVDLDPATGLPRT